MTIIELILIIVYLVAFTTLTIILRMLHKDDKTIGITPFILAAIPPINVIILVGCIIFIIGDVIKEAHKQKMKNPSYAITHKKLTTI